MRSSIVMVLTSSEQTKVDSTKYNNLLLKPSPTKIMLFLGIVIAITTRDVSIKLALCIATVHVHATHRG